MGPLARLAVARGATYAQIDELLRSAFVDAARAAHPDIPRSRAVSRISAATGLNRREVTRRIHDEPVEAPRRSPATETFARWLSDPAFRSGGKPLESLPRQGAAPSFEALAQGITKDVHPRSVLEEMCRLGLARIDEATDSVVRLRERFVPVDDELRLFGLLGANVGDHLSAAVANVLSRPPRNLEQAVFADGLSAHSVEQLRPLVKEQWQALVQSLVPTVRELIDQDNASGREQNQRLRVGMYAYAEEMPELAREPIAAVGAPKKRAASRRKEA